jgi:DNA-binding transcriptional ArsR family regulator
MDPVLENLSEQQANFCRVFGNSTRVRILWTLENEEMSVGAIADSVGSSIQNISQHLSYMKMHQVVISRRDGQTIYYRVNQDALEKQCSGLFRTAISKVRT